MSRWYSNYSKYADIPEFVQGEGSASRIKLLNKYLEDPDIIEEQKINIREAIRLYEEGLLKPPHYGFVIIQDGKVVDIEAIRTADPSWTEGIARQPGARILAPSTCTGTPVSTPATSAFPATFSALDKVVTKPANTF